MTMEQLAAELTDEFDEHGNISYTIIEENLQLIFDNFSDLSDYMDPDILEALMFRLEDPMAVYQDRVKEFAWQQQKILVGEGRVVHSVGFQGFQGFEGRFQNENQGIVGMPEGKKRDFLPEWFPDVNLFIRSVSESLQVSFGMVAPAVLATVSLSLMKKYIIHMQGDHKEPTNLYIAVIAEASE